MEGDFTSTSSPLLTLVSFGLFVAFPIAMILLVTWHVNRRDRRGGICSRCANIRRNAEWYKNGHRH